MKKIITLLFLSTIILNIVFAKEETNPVYNEITTTPFLLQNKNVYNDIYLNIEDLNLTTKNYNFLTDLSIIGVFYKVSPLHQKLFPINYYQFKSSNLDNEIHNLEQEYINKLQNNALEDEANKIYIKGLKLKKIKVYISNEELYYLLKKYPQITYSYELNSDYKTL